MLRGPDADRRPDAKAIRAELLRAVAADPDAACPRAETGAGAAKTDPAALLAAAYRRRVLHLAARDLTGVVTVDQVGEELADIADAVLEAALAIARAEAPSDSGPCRVAVIAMGKCGARELNYASDVDVIFVAEPAEETTEADSLTAASRLASGVIQVCERSTPEGSIFPVDPNLRPEGRNGPLVRTLASYLAYYDRWAKTWEFQALLKARPAAGDMDLGQKYKDAVTPLVWQASRRENFVEDVQAMRRRVEATLPRNMAGRELKLGPGGLRDIEFAVQLLQLVHGRTDERLRVPATLPALKALADGGYVGRADADDLAGAYRFLRQTEHLLQLYQLQENTHAADGSRRTSQAGPGVACRRGFGGPEAPPRGYGGPRRPPIGGSPGGLSPLGLTLLPKRPSPRPGAGTPSGSAACTRSCSTGRCSTRWRGCPADTARLTPEAARARLEALGYRDPAGALRHIEALTTGVRRRAAIQRTLLPVLLGWFADAAEPDAGLLGFRQVSEALGETPWFLRLLRDETKAAARIAHVLASSRYATGLLLRAPEAVAIFADDAELVPREVATLRSEMLAAARRHEADAEQAAVAVRSLRRRELLRVAAARVLGLTGLVETEAALTAITTASLEAVLAATIAKIEIEQRGPLPTRFAVGSTEKLFQPFQHGAQTTGLGLFLSRAFVRSFHGELRHDPTVAGCSFVIELAVAGPSERESSRMAEHGTHPVATA